MFYTIYKTTNLKTGHIYIGKHQTKDLHDNYLGSGKRLKYAINKYGLENFKKEILHVFETEQEMNAKEAELVTEEFCSRDDTYNICVGGKGGWSYVNTKGLNLISEESKALGVAKWKKTIEENPELLKIFANNGRKHLKKLHSLGKIKYDTFTGKKHTKEAKRKMSKSQAGKHDGIRNSQYGTCWITNGIENKKIKKENLEEWTSLGFYRGRV